MRLPRWLRSRTGEAAEGRAGSAWAAPRLAGPPPASRDLLLERLAALVADSGLTVPAILLAESQRPLLFLYGQLAHFVSPCVDPLLGFPLAEEAGHLLSDRSNLDRFLERLEAQGRKR